MPLFYALLKVFAYLCGIYFALWHHVTTNIEAYEL